MQWAKEVYKVNEASSGNFENRGPYNFNTYCWINCDNYVIRSAIWYLLYNLKNVKTPMEKRYF